MKYPIKALAVRLHDAGYLPVPIRHKGKAPSISDWQDPSSFRPENFGDNNGIGLLCGIGEAPLCGVDVDCYSPDIIELIEVTASAFGDPAKRVGRPPKCLLLFRSDAPGKSKRKSQVYLDEEGRANQLEILRCGQQFVGWGVHPDTGAPYEWVSGRNPEESPAYSLPMLGEADIDVLMDIFENACREKGWKLKSERESSNNSAAGVLERNPPKIDSLTLDQAKTYLSFLPQSFKEGYDGWLKIGQALHFQFDGSEKALNLWDEWSCDSPNYKGYEDLAKKWPTFGRTGRTPITFRSVIKWSNEEREKAETQAKAALVKTLETGLSECVSFPEVDSYVKRQTSIFDDAIRSTFAAQALKRYKELGGAGKTVKDFKDLIPPAVPRAYSLSETGNAARMYDLFGAGILYCAEGDYWLRWCGTRWKKAMACEIHTLAQKTIEHLNLEAKASQDPDYMKFVKISERANMVFAMENLLKGRQEIQVHADQLDADPDLIGCANGYVNVRTGEFKEPSPLVRITQTTGAAFDPLAQCPLFRKTVDEIFSGNKELVNFFQKAMGYSLLGDPVENILFIPYGTGANGKTTLIDILREVFGQYSIMGAADTFIGTNGRANAGGAREDLLRCKGSRLIYVTEPDDYGLLKEGLVKAMTGGESIVARGNYARESVEFKPTWAIWMPTNHKPIIRGQDYGIWRRIVLIPFTRTFREEERDPHRKEKMRSEKSGIFNWLLEGVQMYLKEGLKLPRELQEARKEYQSEMDITADWIDECCEEKPQCFATNVELFASWKNFAEARGEGGRLNSVQSLSRILISKGFRPFQNRHGLRGRGFDGIGIRKG